MKFLNHFPLFLLLSAIIVSSGCTEKDNKDTSDNDTTGTTTKTDDQKSDNASVKDPASLIKGSWTVDGGLTKTGWGDRSAELEKKLLDQLGITIEFKDNNQCSMINNDGNGETYEIYWEVTQASDNALDIVLSESKDAKKKVQVKISFQTKDRMKYQSSEADFSDDLIFVRNSN